LSGWEYAALEANGSSVSGGGGSDNRCRGADGGGTALGLQSAQGRQRGGTAPGVPQRRHGVEGHARQHRANSDSFWIIGWF
jgi:hypothetical protein